jgi:hypothetical protein
MDIAEADRKVAVGGCMFGRLFPRSIDNVYPGYWLGAWIFALVVAGRLAMGVNGTINTVSVATTADGIPLGTYPAAAAETVVALFALTALLNLTLAVLGATALIRYRAMIPFLFLLYLAQSLGTRVLLYVHPLQRIGSATASVGSAFVLGLLALTALGFVLSLVPKPGKAPTGGAA